MFIVGKSFFSEILSKFNIKTIAPLCVIHIPWKMLAVGPLGPQYSWLFAWHELGRHAHQIQIQLIRLTKHCTYMCIIFEFIHWVQDSVGTNWWYMYQPWILYLVHSWHCTEHNRDNRLGIKRWQVAYSFLFIDSVQLSIFKRFLS